MAKRERVWFVIIAVVGIVVALLAGGLLRARPSEVRQDAAAEPPRASEPGGPASERPSPRSSAGREATAIERDPSATVLVDGVVVDGLGGPIEAATISARQAVDRNAVPVAFARSDERGRFSLWLEPGPVPEHADRVWLSARAEGYADATVVVLTPARAVRLALFPESSLAGVVETEAGEPVPGVTVELVPPPLSLLPSWPRAVSDRNGRFELHSLAPGSYRPKVDDRRWYAKLQRIELGLFEQRDDLRVVVSTGHHVRVDVRAPDGSPCLDGRARIRGLDRGGRVDAADGLVSLAGVPAGTHRLVGACPGALEAEREIEVSTDATFSITTNESLIIAGRALDERKQPVVGARVTADRAKTGLAHNLLSAETDERGEFELRGLAPGKIEVSASRSDRIAGDPVALELRVGEPSPFVELQLERGACITGRVEGGPDTLLVVAGSGQRPVTSLRLSDRREFELCGFAPDGEGRLWLKDPGMRMRVPFVYDAAAVDQIELQFPDVAERSIDLRVDASPEHRLRVRVDADAEAEALVKLVGRPTTEPLRGCGRPFPIEVIAQGPTEAGELTFEALYAGRYLVHAEADGAQACVVVEIEGSGDATELDIELAR